MSEYKRYLYIILFNVQNHLSFEGVIMVASQRKNGATEWKIM